MGPREIPLDGRSLDVSALLELATGRARPGITDQQIRAATEAAEEMSSVPAYGRTTGVGANRGLVIAADDTGHALRLWLSHAAGLGGPLPAELSRAAMVVRLNQICTGHTGVSNTCAGALAQALRGGAIPALAHFGSVGTGDLTALAELGLSLAGRRPWLQGTPPQPVNPSSGDGLALLSSNALTIAVASAATDALRRLSRAAVVIAAVGVVAAGGSADAFAEVVWPDRSEGPVPSGRSVRLGSSGGAWVAEVLRDLVRGAGTRLQDPYPLRAAPAWHGPLVTAIDELAAELRREINRSTENPMLHGGSWQHHAAIVATELAAHLDAVRTALVTAAEGALSRLRLLHLSEFTGLSPFLAAGAAGSSGTMVCEYTAASALAELRLRSTPAATGWTVLSLGHEDGASFATQSAFAGLDSVEAYRTVLAAELTVTIRALRLGGWPGQLAGRMPDDLAQLVEQLMQSLPATIEDHDMGGDLRIAADQLPLISTFDLAR